MWQRKKKISSEKYILNAILISGSNNSHLVTELRCEIRIKLKFILCTDLFGLYEKIILLLVTSNLWLYRKLLMMKRKSVKFDFFE